MDNFDENQKIKKNANNNNLSNKSNKNKMPKLIELYGSNNNLISTTSNTSKDAYYNHDNTENNFLTPRNNLINSFKKKDYKNIEYNPYSYESSKKNKEFENDNSKNKYIDLKEIKNNNFFEDAYHYNSISPVTKIYKRNNNYNNNRLLYHKDKNKENNNYIKTYYNNIFYPHFCENKKQSFQNNNQITVYNRLFEDGKNRNKKQREKKLEQEKQLNDLSNQISGYKKKVDYNRINKLYENKEKNKSFEKTKKKVENEEGLTFRPFINKSEYTKRIYSNFMERNYYNNKCLNENNFISSTSSNLNAQKKLTKKQKERIINRIIDKLNTNTPIKNISRSCNKYTKKVNYNSKSHKKKL